MSLVEANPPIIKADHILSESVGIGTLGGVFTPLLDSGAAVPCERIEIFSTAADNQSQIKVSLFRGTNRMAAANHKIGSYQIVDIPPAPRGTPQIAVTFAVKADGIYLAAKNEQAKRALKIIRCDEEPK